MMRYLVLVFATLLVASQAEQSLGSTTSPSTSPSCDNIPCSMPTCPPGTSIVEVPDQSTACCTAYECIGTSSSSPNICATVTCIGMPTCIPGTSPQVVGQTLCCNKYECLPDDVYECQDINIQCVPDDCENIVIIKEAEPEKGICCPEFECRNVATTSTTVPIITPFMSCVDGKDENNQTCSCGIKACEACERENGDIVCTRCKENRFLRSNKCPRTALCVRGKIEDAPEGMQDCECPETLTNCHACMLHASKSAVCDTCRDYTKLHEGECLDECPDQYQVLLKGSSQFGARCEENYRCRKGKISVKDHPLQGEACSCENNCFDCDYIFGRGHVCRKCENKKFLHEGECLDNCEGTGKAHYGHRDRNRICTDTFYCKGGKHSVDNSKCSCPPSVGGASCVRCHFEVGNGPELQARCDRCKSGFLHEGVCLAECPVGYQPNPGTKRRGRFCVQKQL